MCGYFNYLVIIIFILFFHDLGHIFIIKILKYKINKIEIYPFGGIIKTNIGLNSRSIDIFLISIAGIMMQLILFLIFNILFKLGFISLLSYNIFNKYNLLILLFNLLPIYPLDGSKMLSSLLEYFLSFKLTILLSYLISLIFIVILIFYNYIYSLNNYLIIGFLLFKIIEFIKGYKFILNKFYLERLYDNFEYNKVKYIKNINNLRKNYYNFINNESEKKLLARLYMNVS